MHVEPVLVRDEVNGDAEVAEATGPANPVQVRLRHLGEIEVDDDVDGLDVDASREEVRADEVAAKAGPEVVEDPVAVRLGHPRVDVVAGVAQLGDLLGQLLHPLSRVAEDDALVDLQLGGEERVEAVHLLLLGDECVVLRDALERQLVHQVDLVGVAHVLPQEGFHRQREGGGVEQHLSRLRQEGDEPVQQALEVLAQQLVGLVQAKDFAVVHVGHVLLHQVKDAAGGGDYQVNLRMSRKVF